MQDILNGRSIQCFWVPCGINDVTLTVEYKRTKRKFDFDKELPYKSLAYNYSEDFIIFDYENSSKDSEQAWIHIVEGGKCQFFVPSEILNEKYPILLVINKYGIPLKITSPPEFWIMQDEYFKLLKKIERIRQDGLPKTAERIKQQEMLFKLKWYDDKKVTQVCGNIIGIALSILAIKPEYNIKEKLVRYCEKHGFELKELIQEYADWANLQGIDATTKDIEDILL